MLKLALVENDVEKFKERFKYINRRCFSPCIKHLNLNALFSNLPSSLTHALRTLDVNSIKGNREKDRFDLRGTRGEAKKIRRFSKFILIQKRCWNTLRPGFCVAFMLMSRYGGDRDVKMKLAEPEGWTYICLLFHDKRCSLFLLSIQSFQLRKLAQDVVIQRAGAQGKFPGIAFIS